MSKNQPDYIIGKNAHQIFGINGVLAVLNCKEYEIQNIEILERSLVLNNLDFKKIVKKCGLATKIINKDKYLKKYKGKRTQGIVVTFSGETEKTLPSFGDIEGNHCLLILDNITDPQNFGQIIRTAECAGIGGIIIPERRSVGITDTVLQVSQGAFCHIPIYKVTNLSHTLSQLKDDGFWTVALENSIYAKLWNEIDYRGKIAIIVGSEGQGIKPLVLKPFDFQATIPMQSKTGSLNVSAAVAAVVFERLRHINK